MTVNAQDFLKIQLQSRNSFLSLKMTSECTALALLNAIFPIQQKLSKIHLSKLVAIWFKKPHRLVLL